MGADDMQAMLDRLRTLYFRELDRMAGEVVFMFRGKAREAASEAKLAFDRAVTEARKG